MNSKRPKLKLLSFKTYQGILKEYSVIFYYLPIFAHLYRKRVELCLAECKSGKKILEIGFGSGLTFLNLNEMYKEIHGLDLTCDIEEVKKVFAKHNIYPHLQNGDARKMPYADDQFDTILIISTLEHLKPNELDKAFLEIKRVLKPGGQVIYGVPVERPFMVFMFRLLGYDIRDHHFSTERDIETAASHYLKKIKLQTMKASLAIFGDVYEIGHFAKG